MSVGDDQSTIAGGRFAVWRPRFWWIARRTDLMNLADPDATDQRIRWSDKDKVDWSAVADTADEIAAQLERDDVVADHRNYSDEGTLLWVDCTTRQLGEAEQIILKSWFQTGIPPSMDPWHRHLTDGRHRLWNSWQARPAARLPISSLLLRWASNGHTTRENDNYAKRLRDVPWFDPSVGANRRYAVHVHWVMQGNHNFFYTDHREGPSVGVQVEDLPVPDDLVTYFGDGPRMLPPQSPRLRDRLPQVLRRMRTKSPQGVDQIRDGRKGRPC
ncbi:hypothetical protein HGA13_07875 [Nocardia speluncae]|uniref:Uncharacterized protein n=1 Tax=Nocardia speluncae TaxID=419477 RepID=A0A846X9R5_9NOCA|nr:hypothetical protein [Nocardia speluncae]NKY32991.1 hypothetical protein [Nocardia speluncae]